jgi:hypothetical protein
MARASSRPLALLLAFATGASGCSFLTLRSPPGVVANPSKPFTACDAPPPQAVVDTLLFAGYGTLLGVAVSQDQATTANVFWSSLLLAGLASSAIYGYSVGARCAEMDELGARCRKKDLQACLALNPGFDPSRPVGALLLCAKDADCPADRRCLQSGCVERLAPPPSPPPPPRSP